MAAKWYAWMYFKLCRRFAHTEQDDSDPNLFATEIRNCAGTNVALTLWSAKVALNALRNRSDFV